MKQEGRVTLTASSLKTSQRGWTTHTSSTCMSEPQVVAAYGSREQFTATARRRPARRKQHMQYLEVVSRTAHSANVGWSFRGYENDSHIPQGCQFCRRLHAMSGRRPS